MNKADTFTIMKDMFGKNGSEEQVEGLTLIIDGKLKEVFDTIIGKSDDYKNYTDVLSSVIVHGVNEIIGKLQ
jgi:predicted component of type VI protein secretion system